MLAQYHQGQVRLPRFVVQLRAIGVAISKRQVMRQPIAGQDNFSSKRATCCAPVCRPAPGSRWTIPGRHKATNGFCTQIGNDSFAWFGTTSSKSRLNFLALLRAGHTDYVINDAALAYMHDRALAGPIIAGLAQHADKHFADPSTWQAHLERLGITALTVTPDPTQIATEGALCGAASRRMGFSVTR